MKYYYYSYESQTITHEQWPANHWQSDYCIGTNFKEIKKHTIEDMQDQINRLKESLKIIRAMKVEDVQPTPGIS